MNSGVKQLFSDAENAALNMLSQDWSGFVLAAIAAITGASTAAPRGRGKTLRSFIGFALMTLATTLATGASRHLARVARTRAAYPPPGKLIDVGGYRMHVLAEGEGNGKPPVVIMPGSHTSGYGLYHLHAALRNEMRSILIDRPGAGWSDIGPFPRTTMREADEVIAALEVAGERGPFVLAGHSFGGLLMGNVAKKRPDLVAALLLLDATPPDTIIYGPRFASLAASRRGFARIALATTFGFDVSNAQQKETRHDPTISALLNVVAERLGDAGRAMSAVENAPRAHWAAYSIFAELSPTGIAAAAWDLAIYDGDLDGLPVYLVAPGDVDSEAGGLPPGDEAGVARMKRVLKHSRERYMLTSNRSERITTPPGTGHLFPFQAPEFVLDVVRRVCAVHSDAADSDQIERNAAN